MNDHEAALVQCQQCKTHVLLGMKGPIEPHRSVLSSRLEESFLLLEESFGSRDVLGQGGEGSAVSYEENKLREARFYLTPLPPCCTLQMAWKSLLWCYTKMQKAFKRRAHGLMDPPDPHNSGFPCTTGWKLSND